MKIHTMIFAQHLLPALCTLDTSKFSHRMSDGSGASCIYATSPKSLNS